MINFLTLVILFAIFPEQSVNFEKGKEMDDEKIVTFLK